MVVDDIQLHQGSSAGAVDQNCHLMAGVINVCQDLIQQMIHDFIGRGHFLAVGAGLAMNADTDFHLVLGKLKARLSGSRHGAGRNGRTHRAHIVNNLLRNALNFF